jgi:integrase
MPLADVSREAIVEKLIHPLLTEDGVAEDKASVPRGQRRRRRASRAMVKNVLAALSGCLNHAVEAGKLAANPAVRLGRLLRDKDATGEPKADFLTAEELSKLLATCLDRWPYYFPFVSLLARTGLRLGEAIGLKWGDIDWNSGFIQISRTASARGVSSPKSGKGRRVDMSAVLAGALNQRLVKARETALAAGQPLSDWVFTDPRGGRLEGQNFRSRIWKLLLAKAGLRHVRIHDLRHTYASLLIQDGWPLKYVQEQGRTPHLGV